jgi:MFS transporter, VNT family, synaptic vesicle glycoprotein 2
MTLPFFLINTYSQIISVFVLTGCGICGIITILTPIPTLSIYFYVVLLMCGLAITVVNAATVDLYPTHLRAMAVCTSLMMGRLGSVVGSYIVGAILESNCTVTFLLSGTSLILCGALSFAIPNIYNKSGNAERRHSISSIGQ